MPRERFDNLKSSGGSLENIDQRADSFAEMNGVHPKFRKIGGLDPFAPLEYFEKSHCFE